MDEFTVIMIPQATENTVRFRVNQRGILMALGTTVILLVALIFLLGFRLSQAGTLAELKEIKVENRQQAMVIQQLQGELDQLNLVQEEIVAKQERLRQILGVAENDLQLSESGYTGQGGEETSAERFDRQVSEQVSRGFVWRQTQADLNELLVLAEEKEMYYRRLPNQWPAVGTVTSEYGMRKSPFGGSSVSMHDGIDIANRTGTAIVAAADGIVTYSGSMPAYGYAVMIDHGNGLVTKYGHNSKLLVQVGQTVTKGETIAEMGSTGRSTGTHVHFTVYRQGETVDPHEYLQ
jgi:murein DD-endopeptidase MepM/ murein hydrolase activator NlpD